MKKQVLKPDKFYERILQSNGNYLIADYKEEVLTKEVEIEGVRWIVRRNVPNSHFRYGHCYRLELERGKQDDRRNENRTNRRSGSSDS